MPNIDETAKAWQVELAGWLGANVQARRKALNMTALQLAARTKELGDPVTRVAISKIETNTRAGKFDLAELFVLAAALDLPPSLLLFPGGEHHELLPGVAVADTDSRRWLSGTAPLPGDDPNTGTKLIAAIARRAQLRRELFEIRVQLGRGQTTMTEAVAELAEVDPADVEPPLSPETRSAYEAASADRDRQLHAVKAEIAELNERLWDSDA
jgi:transcriptional regulator with XRE-family HTH domain